MATTVTRPSGRRADDVRALRFRYRSIAFTGSYTNGTGEVITAASLSLKRILGVIPLDGMIRVPTSFTGFLPDFNISADGRTLTIKMSADAAGAAAASFGQERSTGAYTAGEAINVIVVGEG